jgi:hypothetical protein
MGVKHYSIPIVSLALIALSSCTPIPTTIPSNTIQSISSSTSTPDFTPTPTLTVQYEDLQLIRGIYEDEFTALGILVNQSDLPLHNVRIKVVLIDESGKILASKISPLAMERLKLNESSPFEVAFNSPAPPDTFTVEVVDYEQEDFTRAKVNYQTIESVPNGEGGLVLLGRVSNPNDQAVDLLEIGLMAYDQESELVAVGNRIVGRLTIAPGAETLILIEFQRDPGIVDFVVWQDSIIAELTSRNPLQIIDPPEIGWTDQDHPFVASVIQNQDTQPLTVSAYLEIKVEDESVALSQIELPIPIPPGALLPLASSDFPGYRNRIPPRNSETEVTLDFVVESKTLSPAVTIHPLDLEITGYEAIGSSLFLNITLSNSTEERVLNSTVFVSLYDIQGNLLTAGWKSAGKLPPGGSQQLVLDLPLPAGVDPTMAEYELAAYGLGP